MVSKRVLGRAAAVLLVGLGVSAAGAQRQPAAGALGTLERGQWVLRSQEGQLRRMCLGNPAMLVQVMHGGTQCEHVVVEGAPNATTIRYSCRGHGTGRSVIRVETPRLLTMETQGVANGAPFSEQFEARRVGACG